MKCTVFYIANVAQLAGIFGMIYVQIQHKPAKISTKPRAAYIADKQRTITLHCDSKAPENYCVLSYSFLSLAHPFLKYALLKGHWFLLAVLQKATEKLHPVQICFVLLPFWSISKYASCLSTKYGAGGAAAKEPAQSSLGTDLLHPLHRLRKPLTPICLCRFG